MVVRVVPGQPARKAAPVLTRAAAADQQARRLVRAAAADLVSSGGRSRLAVRLNL
jgi:hypothetical protein